ncbi:MAG: prepilin-type N-terminal cleavage/methylation domain-containing protein [Candidatus Moranbacteria bacterium]|nr:prepilin-type N-terminal cleavage/methylation domain-containing protein [Candidatus Moranbacteria bacterium]
MLRLQQKKLKAFTLIEMLVSLFIFTLMMVSVTEIFTKAFVGSRSARDIGRDVENVQYALNTLTKQLRTSSVVSQDGNSQSSVKFYDYSQGKCFQYQVFGQALQVASSVVADRSACQNQNFAIFETVSTGTVTGSFAVTKSSAYDGPADHVGRVTITLVVSEDATHVSRLQTTASLRDFGAINL